MTSLSNNGSVYTILIERNSNQNNSDSTLKLFFDSSLKNEPYEFHGIITQNGNIEFNGYDYEKDSEIKISGTFINDTSFSLNLSNWKELNINKLIFTEKNKDYILYPINYFKSKLYIETDEELMGSMCDSFTSHININSYIFKVEFTSDIVRIIDKKVVFDNYKTLDDFFKNYNPELQTIDIDFQVIHFDNGFLTLKMFYDSYGCGAAHNQYSIDYINFDIYNKTEVKLSDIFSRDLLGKIENICKKKFKLKYNKSDEELEEFKIPKSYAVLKKGILFQFQPYEMGSFAEGAMSIFLPYSEVSVLLEKNETVQRLLER